VGAVVTTCCRPHSQHCVARARCKSARSSWISATLRQQRHLPPSSFAARRPSGGGSRAAEPGDAGHATGALPPRTRPLLARLLRRPTAYSWDYTRRRDPLAADSGEHVRITLPHVADAIQHVFRLRGTTEAAQRAIERGQQLLRRFSDSRTLREVPLSKAEQTYLMGGGGKSVPEAIVRQGVSWELLAWSAQETTPAPTAGPSSAAPLAPAAPRHSSAGATASAGGAAPAPIAAAVTPLVSLVAGELTVTATSELRGGIQVQAACGNALVGAAASTPSSPAPTSYSGTPAASPVQSRGGPRHG